MVPDAVDGLGQEPACHRHGGSNQWVHSYLLWSVFATGPGVAGRALMNGVGFFFRDTCFGRYPLLFGRWCCLLYAGLFERTFEEGATPLLGEEDDDGTTRGVPLRALLMTPLLEEEDTEGATYTGLGW